MIMNNMDITKSDLTSHSLTKFFSEEVYEIADEVLIELLRQMVYIGLVNMREPGAWHDDKIVKLLKVLEKEREDENRESLRSLGIGT